MVRVAVYEIAFPTDSYKLNERHLYGAERLGVNSEEVTIYQGGNFTPYTHKEEDVVHTKESGHKRYELTNHLGNVLATINDRKIYNSTDQNYEPVLLSWSDYYAFGMTMPGRNGNTGEYRYGMNGMEMDSELSGEGNTYDFGARMYNPRLGRWFAIDKLKKKYPYLSPYQYTANCPIAYMDKDGNDHILVITRNEKTGRKKLQVISVTHLYGRHSDRVYKEFIDENPSGIFSKSSLFITSEGEEWEIEIVIKFIVNKELDALGDEVPSQREYLDFIRRARAMSSSFKRGHNLVCTHCEPEKGNVEDALVGGTHSTGGAHLGLAAHATWHMMGFWDHYQWRGDIASPTWDGQTIREEHFIDIGTHYLEDKRNNFEFKEATIRGQTNLSTTFNTRDPFEYQKQFELQTQRRVEADYGEVKVSDEYIENKIYSEYEDNKTEVKTK